MKSFFAANISVGDELENEPFLIQDSILRETKDARTYLLSTLRDKTGQLAFVIWDIPSYVENWSQTGSPDFRRGQKDCCSTPMWHLF